MHKVQYMQIKVKDVLLYITLDTPTLFPVTRTAFTVRSTLSFIRTPM